MKRFAFRLERVLGIRRFELERARIALIEAEAEASRLAAALVEAERRLLEGRRLLEEETVKGADGPRIALRAQAVRAGRARWLFARNDVESFEPKRASARALVRRCRARVESLERLRERRAELHQKAALAAEQAELEGLAMARFARASVVIGLVCGLLLSPVPAQAEAKKHAASEAEKVEASEASGTEAASQATGETVAAATEREHVDLAPLLSGPGYSRGVDSILAEVQAREVSIAQREVELEEREVAVQELEEMVAQRAAELERIRAEVEHRIASWTSQGQDRIGQLSGVYAAMPPGDVAELLGKLDLDLAVSVIRQMKKKVSASVLAAMRPDRALLISRRILQPLDPATDGPPAHPSY